MLDKILGVAKTQRPQPASATFYRVRSSAGISVDEDTALTYSAVFSAVKVISETVAMLPWRPYLERGGRRELQAGSDLDVLLHRRPNEEQTAFQWREFLVACALLHGNGYAEIERANSGRVLAMHPLHPSRVEPRRTDSGKLYYWVRNEGGGGVDVLARQMFHLRGPTADGVIGRSVLALARESWGLGIASEQFAAAFFGNGAVPSLVIQEGEGAPSLTKEGVQNMLSSFESRHKGTKNAGKPGYLEHGFSIEAIGVPQKDAQFLETRKFSVTDVARWFRVPPHKIADMEKATFSNIESQERNFVNDAIMPWAVRLEQEANAKLIDDSLTVTKLDFRGLLRGDSKDRGEFYRTMRDLGAMDINEIRQLEDMNPIDGGDLRLVPMNMVSVKRAAQGGGTDYASAIRGVILDAHERMITKEARAVERASRSKDLVAWGREFYGRHGPQMVDALMPGAQALGAAVGLGVDLVRGIVESHVQLHCEASLACCASSTDVGERARAPAQTDRLIGLIVGASHG